MHERAVMIVEDDRGTRAVLAGFFARRGWEVAEVGTVAEGLALLEAGAAPSLLILDLSLPDGGGESILSRVRAAGLPCFVVVSSGCADSRRLEAVERLSPNCLLPKPYDVAALCRACGITFPQAAPAAAALVGVPSEDTWSD